MNRSEMKTSRYFLAWVLLLLSSQHLAHAQGAASTIVGNVMDPSGAGISQATITIQNADTGTTREVRTNESGGFSVPSLSAGRYVVTANASGFATEKRMQIRLEYQQTQRVDFVLRVGDVSQSVTVEANVATLQTDDASTATVLDERQIRDLPLNGRNFIQLTQLVPGTTAGAPGNGNTGFAGQGFAVSAYGQRDWNNQYTLDGVDMTEARNPAPEFLPAIDAIQEFDVKSGVYSAEYGWKGGAHVDIAIKPGTNQFHGNVYEFLRNDFANAKNYFATKVDDLKRNQFGATFGGPIQRNKLFFFGAYDETRQIFSATQFALVPTPQQLSGDFSSSPTPIIDPTTGLPFPGNIIPSNRIDPNATILGAFYPAPNLSGVFNFTRAGAAFDNTREWFTRVDYNISDRDHVFGRFASSKRKYGDPPVIADFAGVNPLIADNVAIQEVHIFTPKILNSLLLGFSYYHREIADAKVYSDIAKQLTIPHVADNPLITGIPYISIDGYSPIGQGAFSPLIFHNQNFQLSDNLSIQQGNHSIKVGFEVQKFRFEQTFIVWPRGFFEFSGYATGNTVADFLLGLPVFTQVANALTPGHLFNTPSSYYVQDDWKARPNLTVNAGFRYELNPPVHDSHGLARNLDLKTGNLFPATNVPVPLWNLDKGDVAFRLGFAYRPFNNERTVIRAGSGLFYSTPELNIVTDGNLNPPFGVTNSFLATSSTQLTFEDPYPSATGLPQGAPTIFADAPNLKNARTALWNLDVQHSLKSFIVDIGYTGSRTTHLVNDSMPNQPTPGDPATAQTRRLFPQYGKIYFFQSGGWSTYEGLQVKVEKRVSKGLFLLGSYTWSKAIDLSESPIFGDAFAGYGQDKNNLAADKGLAPSNLKHVFSLSYGYELPFGRNQQFAAHMNPLGEALIGGWQINGIVSWHTGSPFSVFSYADIGVAYDTITRATQIAPNGNLPSTQRTLSRWFDTSAYVDPVATFGNSGRDSLIGPGMFNMDVSLFKGWSFERFKVQLRGEAFNVTNHPNFGFPGNYVGIPGFGAINYAGSPRILQIATKVSF
jgi:hypothetical protein